MDGGAGPAVLLPADSNPAGKAQDPIDLVSETSESAADDSSVVAPVVVEPTDQAAADVPCLTDLMTTSDFTRYLLNDPILCSRRAGGPT